MIDLLTTFPTVLPSALLLFCLTWWLATLLISGIGDGPHDGHLGHGHMGHAGAGRVGGARGAHPSAARGRAGKAKARVRAHGTNHPGGHRPSIGDRIAATLGLGIVPVPLTLTLFSFGAWATSLVLQGAIGAGPDWVVSGV